MSSQIHYEIFVRRTSHEAWTLRDANDKREEAVRLAEELVKQQPNWAVRVTKETFNPDTGAFLTLKVFEGGKEMSEARSKVEKVDDAVPCFKPDDLYSYHARLTLGRILAEPLARWKLTVSEFMHRADALERFEVTGTLYQQAVQKVAVTQAAGSGKPVIEFVKSLNDLSTRAISRVLTYERDGKIPAVKEGKIGALAAKLAENPEGDFLLKCAIAKYLAPAQTWDAKLMLVLGVMHELPEGEAARKLLLGTIDTLVSEIVSGAAGLGALLGEQPNLGSALLAMVDLYLGRAQAEQTGEGLAALSAEFKAGTLVNSRSAIAHRVLAELKGMKRLDPKSLDEEVRLLRVLASRMVMGPPNLIAQEDIVAAFIVRSKRLVTPETVTEFVGDAQDPDARILRVLQLEENVIGVENKRRLAAFIQPQLTDYSGQTFFIEGKRPILERLQRLAALQTRVLRSGFQEIEKRTIAEAIDGLAVKAEAKAKFLDTVVPKTMPQVTRTLALLQLFVSDAVTEGQFSKRVRAEMAPGLKEPDFVPAFVMRSGGEQEKAIANLKALLIRAGVASETATPSADVA